MSSPPRLQSGHLRFRLGNVTRLPLIPQGAAATPQACLDPGLCNTVSATPTRAPSGSVRSECEAIAIMAEAAGAGDEAVPAVTFTESTFNNGRGQALHVVRYVPSAAAPRAVLLWHHGYGEHVGRYDRGA